MEQQKIIDLEQNCSTRGILFTDQSKRVLDHCHLTGKYRGVAHNNCNLNYKLAKFFPIFFHNLSAYDAHLFVKELVKIPGDISIIPLNKEFYISISKKIYINPNETLELRLLRQLSQLFKRRESNHNKVIFHGPEQISNG